MTQTVPDISPLMPMHQDPLLVVVYGGVLAAIICVPTACARRPRGALGDLTALLLRCRCEATAFARRSFRSPWDRRATARNLCMHKLRAVAWHPRRPHGVQWRCHGDPSALWEISLHAPRRSEFLLHAVQSPWGRHPGVTGALLTHICVTRPQWVKTTSRLRFDVILTLWLRRVPVVLLNRFDVYYSTLC